jgi:hypothetical protein
LAYALGRIAVYNHNVGAIQLGVFVMNKHVGTNEINKEIGANAADPVFQSRRRLLKLGAYVPPAILGMAIISTAHASDDKDKGGGNSGSCNPSACNPCLGGGKDKREEAINAAQCRKAQKMRN